MTEGVEPAGVAEQAEQGEQPPILDEEARLDLEDAQADVAEDFLNGLLDVLGMEGEAEAEIDEGSIFVEFDGPDMAVLIGRHGLTLEALQELTRAAVQHKTSSHARLTLDIDGYRERQQEILERKARGIAAKVRRDGHPVALDPMNAYERRIVHSVLSDFEGVATASEGEDPDRHVVIKPA